MTLRSHLTQVMQNYFDATDVRSRENPTSLEAQILNMAALSLEDLTSRITRESNQTLQTVPVNIDNGGVYYTSRVPEAFLTGPDQKSLNSVIGKLGSVETTLTIYDDTRPIPSRIELDSNNSVTMSDPILFTIIGTGDLQAQIYTVQHAYPGILPSPDQLTVWLDQIGLNQTAVNITIVGEVAPRPAWVSERKKTTEILTISAEGSVKSRNRWAVIDSVSVRGLPTNARLRGWGIPFNLPATPDVARPYTTPQDRDSLFPRYWQISSSESLLKELYRAGGLTGLELANSYLVNDTMIGVAVEPNTNGIYVASSGTLYYADRREVMPDLSQTAIYTEPLYGLQVQLDGSKSGYIRYVTLSGTPYSNANAIFQYRFTVNGINSILPDGSLGPLSAGWRGGAPKDISFPMLTTGDYQFRLEMQDAGGILTYDAVPYRNGIFSPLKSLDVSSLINEIRGIAFDSYNQLWLWNGSFAIPVKIHYDGYIFDADSKSIFVTDVYDSLQIS